MLPAGTADLRFSGHFNDTPTSDLRLFEIEEELIDAVVAGGVVLKGSPDEEVVLTTPARTYAVRMLETTNLLLLAPLAALGKGAPVEIPYAAYATLEVVRTAPRLSTLRALLALRPYRGRAADGGGPAGDTFSFAELCARVQASEGEIRAALAALSAVEVDGRWRLVDPPAALETLRLVLATLAEQSWPLAAVPAAALAAALPQIDAELLGHVLSTHGSVASGSSKAGDAVYALSASLVTASLGVYLLASSNRRQRVTDFMEKWRQEADEYGVAALSLDMLRGRAVSDGSGAEAVVWYWPVEALPAALKERLVALFAGKARWTADELRPYVHDFLEPGALLEAFLARHTRPISSASGARLYAAREG